MTTLLSRTDARTAFGVVTFTGVTLGSLVLVAPPADAQVFGVANCTVIANVDDNTVGGGWDVPTPASGEAPAVDASLGAILPGANNGAVVCIAGSFCRGTVAPSTALMAGHVVEVVIAGTPGNDLIFGSVCNDLIDGGDGDDTIYGLDGSDTLIGGLGNDSLNGGQGDDELHGGDGNDTLHGNEGDDTLSGGTGNDNVNGHHGDDCMIGDSGNDELYGWAGMDFVAGETGADFIQGNDNADTLLGGTGADTLRGNDGPDNIWGDSQASLLFEQNVETAPAPAMANYITEFNNANGTQVNASLLQAAIDDFVTDNIVAYFDSTNGMTTTGDHNPDCVAQTNTVGTAGAFNNTGFVGWTAGAAVPVTFNDNIRGGVGDDIIRGEAGADSLFGDDGNDTIFGEGNTACSIADGFDFGMVVGDTTGPTLATQGGLGNECTDINDLLPPTRDGDGAALGTAGVFTQFSAIDENEVDYHNAAGNDSISGNNGDDSLLGGGGNDNIRGNADDDHLEGGNSTIGGITDSDNGTQLAGTGVNVVPGTLGAGMDRLDGGSEWDACDPDLGFVENCEIIAIFV